MTDENHSGESLMDFAEKVLVRSYAKLAKVNLMTGEYVFIKKLEELNEPEYDCIDNIYTYIRRQVEDGVVPEEYAAGYAKYSDPEYVQKRAFSGESRAVHSFKRLYASGFKWVTFGVIGAEGCSPENPWALFFWRLADTDTTTMVDTLTALSPIYYKILKINLTLDTYDPVKVTENLSELPYHISEWFAKFAEDGNVHPDDFDDYTKFTDIGFMRMRLDSGAKKLSCRYRRKIGEGFRWVQLDVVPSIEYTDDNKVMILYVKDVHEEYVSELNRRKRMDEVYHRDALTLLYNRHRFNEDLEEIDKDENKSLTLMYVDVNGLHELNNHLGHSAGDDMLCAVADALRKYFPEDIRYRIGGDEFVVLSTAHTKRTFEITIDEARRDLRADNYEIAVGIAHGDGGVSVQKVVAEAELKMREDKEEYYKRHGDRRRKRAMNAELEKILVEKHDEDEFLKTIAGRFNGVYFVNMATDSCRHIYIPPYFLELLQRAEYSYSEAMNLYVDRYVDGSFAVEFKRLLDYRLLQGRLRRGTVTFNYKKVDGTGIELKIHELESKNPEQKETLWIYTNKA